MGATYEIRSDRNLVIVRCTGTITASNSPEAFAACNADPSFEPGFSIFLDLSETTEIDFSFGEMLSHLYRRAPVYRSWGPTRLAMYAPHDPVFGTARMYASLVDQIETLQAEVFRDRNEAFAFLAAEDG